MKNRWKSSIKRSIFGILFVAGISCFPNRASAVCVRYHTAAEAVYTESYNRAAMDLVQGSPLEAEAANGVDPSTGKLTLLRTDLSLEGMAGMDLDLTRYYDSKKAQIGKAVAEEKTNFAMDTVRISFTAGSGKKQEIVVNTAIYNKHKDALKDMFVSYEKAGKGNYTVDDATEQTKLVPGSDYNVYGISTGWAFDFPWIETMTLGSDPAEIPVYLHYGSLGTMRIATDGNHRITGFQNYGYQDIKLEDFNQTVEGTACRYLLRNKAGLRTYFNKDGVVVMQKDNHDNTIRFTYRNGIYFDTITDSVGRKVKFDYAESAHGLLLLQKVSVEGQKAAGGVSKKTITYKSSETAYQSIRGEKMYGSRLNSVTVDGTKETYTYDTVESLANTAGAGVASQRAVTNETYLLTGAEEEGCIQKYEYRAGAVRTGKAAGSQDRDVVTQHYYVTREYEQAAGNTKKKANGKKYDYFQKQTDSKGNTQLVSYDDLDDEKHEMQAYGTDRLQCVTLVSSYNPNKKQKAKKFTDYVFGKKDIDTATLQLKKKPKKSTTVYLYNANRLLVSETAEGKKKTQTEYAYDQGGLGSLVMFATTKEYGTKRTGNGTISKNGYTYDRYRNLLTWKQPKAYRAKYTGKEHLFTTTYRYAGTGNGYPLDGNTTYCLSQVQTSEAYLDTNTKSKQEAELSENNVDIQKVYEYVSEKGTDYRKIRQGEMKADVHGNIISTKEYPHCGTKEMGDLIQMTYQYNALGQMTKSEVQKTSDKHPEQNQSYVEEENQYDSFGNLLHTKDRNGIQNSITYDEETGEEKSTTDAVGTAFETKEQTYFSDDRQKSMTLDYYGRCTVDILDSFGNTILAKDEKAGTWTESQYDYGEENEEEEEGEEDSVSEGQLVEECTYGFDPTEEKIITKADGTKEYNYEIAGKKKELLTGTRTIYDDDQQIIASASFSGGAMDASHCSEWVITKREEETEETGTKSTTWTKQLNPGKYEKEIDPDTYYNQFDHSVQKETIVTTNTDEDGNTLSETTKEIKGENIRETVVTYTYDDFDRTLSQCTQVQEIRNGESKNKSEEITAYEYDYQGNAIKTEVKSRKDSSQTWVTHTTKAEYNDLGQQIRAYDEKGINGGYATLYEYDLSGQMIREIIPVEKKEGRIQYQTNTIEYDPGGNVTAEEQEQDENQVQRTEYQYDPMNQLTQVKNIDSKQSLYTQYLYDREGNKIRQFTGLTKPLDICLAEGKGDNSYRYMGHDYHVEIAGKARKDIVSETKYEYNKKNELISFTDPEGETERYTYDIYGNLVQKTEKNGATVNSDYDYQNRLRKETATDRETKKKTIHTYSYDLQGNIQTKDNRRFSYDAFTGRVVKETLPAGKQSVEKTYQYDSDGVVTHFAVKIGGKTELSAVYEYDGDSRLQKVIQTEDGKKETAAEYQYDENGNQKKVTGQIVESNYTYDPANRLTVLTNRSRQGALLSQYQAAYSKNGQKTEEKEEIRGTDGLTEKKTSRYTYDRIGRLTKESHTGKEDITYVYDAHNNRKEMQTSGQIIAYRYNKNEELIRTDTLDRKTEQDTVTLYRYDQNGNQLAEIHRRPIDRTKKGAQFDLNVTLGSNRLNDNAVTHYNAFNQPEEILTRNSKVSYQYDTEGLRAEKTVNGKKTFCIWDGDQLVMELDGEGKVIRRYIRGNGLLYTDTGMGTKRQYYVQDSHGNVVQLLNEDGSIAKKYTYDAFGNEEKPDKKDKNPMRYCGEYYDKETETLYLRARCYSAETGRFTTRDTYTGEESDPLSLHLYTYCRNDGVNQVDPSGHDPAAIWSGGVDFAAQLANADGPLPILDIAGTAIVGVSAAAAGGSAIYEYFNKAWTHRKIIIVQPPKPKAVATSAPLPMPGPGPDWNKRVSSVTTTGNSVVITNWSIKQLKKLSSKIRIKKLGRCILGTRRIWMYVLVGQTAISSAQYGDEILEVVLKLSSQQNGKESDRKNKKSDKKRTNKGHKGRPDKAQDLQKEVEKGQAPRGVKRVESGNGLSKPHVHFRDGTSINYDGTLHDKSHGLPNLTRHIREWLQGHGWATQIKMK